MPERIQRRRTAGWRMPKGAIYVGRPTVWANPFRIGGKLEFPYAELRFSTVSPDLGVYDNATTVMDIRHAVELYRLRAQISSGFDVFAQHRLAGRNLACWCPLDGPCHADVLLELANQTEGATR